MISVTECHYRNSSCNKIQQAYFFDEVEEAHHYWRCKKGFLHDVPFIRDKNQEYGYIYAMNWLTDWIQPMDLKNIMAVSHHHSVSNSKNSVDCQFSIEISPSSFFPDKFFSIIPLVHSERLSRILSKSFIDSSVKGSRLFGPNQKTQIWEDCFLILESFFVQIEHFITLLILKIWFFLSELKIKYQSQINKITLITIKFFPFFP